ncbi:type I restriction endonuclease subunit R [Thiosocius teredinicola]|uniref:type I restriction endonuclease subunit R n=1 Tax=Thiosocius teredinicola TaxID=1973002 RepID=UPI000990DCE0
MTPEQQARKKIDELLTKAGWLLQNVADANISGGQGVAIREFPLPGHGFADYLLYVGGRAAGVIEAKKEGATLSGVELQSEKYTQGLPSGLPAWRRPLPFSYQSTGTETRFTNGLDPEPRARPLFAFHKPELLQQWLDDAGLSEAGVGEQPPPTYGLGGETFLSRLQQMPPLIEEGLWPAQVKAITNLEKSLRENRPRALIQMATGSGKTFTSISFIYRLIKFAGARRVLFLVDRGNLGDQTLKEFQQYVSPYNNFKFSEEYIVQRLGSNTLDTTARVCICTIQRMYSMLRGKELPPEDEETSVQGLESLFKEQPPIEYNPNIPIETFDLIVTDECHRSIYNLWAQVLEYFDAYLIGLTATPNKQTFGFFNQNLVMEYSHEHAVADGVNVNYDVYRIKTQITEGGSKVEAGYYVEQQDRETREKRWQELDEDLEYQAKQLDRDVVTPDQIRTVARTFRDKLFTEIFPGRTEVPKTLFFAKDDNHAENIVEILREEFGKGNDFAQKITYRTTGATPQQLIKAFRNSYFPRIAVTVDMIATGTDIKPVEIVVFMRTVKSRSFFEQMKGRGVRVINPNDLETVTPDAERKDHFVIVDAVGVCEQDKTDSKPMEKKPAVSFEKLLQAVSFGNTEEAVLTSIAGRLARMEHRLSADDDNKIRQLAQGLGVKDLSRQLVEAVNPDRHLAQARADLGIPPDSDQPVSEQALQAARAKIIQQAVKPLHDPKLRELLVEVKKKNEITIDHVSQDEVIEAGFSADATERARGVVQSFEQFIEDHKDEITALQILYSKPYKARLSFDDIKALADLIQAPPNLWTESQLWQAYAALEKTKVKGAGGRRILTDLVSLVRFAIHQDNELIPFPERVQANFNAWLASQAQSGKLFSDEQRHWLEMIRDHIAANLGIETDDFEYAPFSQEGGLGKVCQLFGDELSGIIEQLNEHLAA